MAKPFDDSLEAADVRAPVGLARRRLHSLPLARPETVPWRAIAVQALGLWAVTRLAFVVFTYFAVTLDHQKSNALPNLRGFEPRALLTAWKQWDVNWYTNIAEHGYHSAATTSFFPLFPLLTALLAKVVGLSHVLGAAMIVSNLAALGALVAIALVAQQEIGASGTSFAVKAFAAYPLAFFTFAGYSDSLFVALCALTLFLARRGSWWWSALVAFLAGLARPVALVLILPLAWEFVRQLRASDELRTTGGLSAKLLAGVAAVAAVPAALGVWGFYLWTKFHDPLIWSKAQWKDWNHQALLPWNSLHVVWHALSGAPAWSFPQARILLDFSPLVIFAILTVFAARRLPSMFTLYMVCVLGLLVVSVVPRDFDPVNAESRYLLMAVPIFVALGGWMSRRPWLDLLVVSLGFLLQGACAAFWLRGGWIV